MVQASVFLIFAGVFATLTAGLALQETLRQAYFRDEKPILSQLIVPFLAICAGLATMLAGGLQILGFSLLTALGIALLLVVALAAVVWWRLLVELSGTAPPPF